MVSSHKHVFPNRSNSFAQSFPYRRPSLLPIPHQYIFNIPIPFTLRRVFPNAFQPKSLKNSMTPCCYAFAKMMQGCVNLSCCKKKKQIVGGIRNLRTCGRTFRTFPLCTNPCAVVQHRIRQSSGYHLELADAERWVLASCDGIARPN